MKKKGLIDCIKVLATPMFELNETFPQEINPKFRATPRFDGKIFERKNSKFSQ